MTIFSPRMARLQSAMAGRLDLVFLPLGADLQYLTGIPRDMPTYGATVYPGRWLEGLWLAAAGEPILTLPRMTATFHGLDQLPYDVRVLGDADDAAGLVATVLAELGVAQKARIGLGDVARGDTAAALQSLLPQARFLSASALVNQLRRRKDAAEIAALRRAGGVTEAAFAAVLPMLRPGMTELDIVSEIDLQLKRHGALGPSFTTAMYNSGPNHPLIFGHQAERWQRPLLPPVALLFDFGAVVDGYCYDFGRTVAFGAPPPALQEIHALVMASQAAGIQALCPRRTAAAADAAARAVIAAAGYGSAFRHRLGHGIGLDVHEAPFLTADDATPLEEGMTFTVEPSIMQLDTFSARVEDVVVVRDGGGEPLTSGFQALIVIE